MLPIRRMFERLFRRKSGQREIGQEADDLGRTVLGAIDPARERVASPQIGMRPEWLVRRAAQGSNRIVVLARDEMHDAQRWPVPSRIKEGIQELRLLEVADALLGLSQVAVKGSHGSHQRRTVPVQLERLLVVMLGQLVGLTIQLDQTEQCLARAIILIERYRV